MFDNFSYKMNASEIKSHIRTFYLPLLHNFLLSNDYKKIRKKYILVISTLIILALSFVLHAMLSCNYTDGSEIYQLGLLATVLLICYVILAPLILYINQKFIKYVKCKLINNVIQEYTSLKEFKHRENLPYVMWEALRQQKDEDFLIKNHELLISSQLFTRLFDHRITYCAYIGNYKDTDFAIENMNLISQQWLYSLHTTFSKYKGIIIKATFNHKLDKLKCDNEDFKKIISKVGEMLNAKETKYSFYSNNIMLAFSTESELFKCCNLLNLSKSSVNVERFISQLAGILIFMDFVSTEF